MSSWNAPPVFNVARSFVQRPGRWNYNPVTISGAQVGSAQFNYAGTSTPQDAPGIAWGAPPTWTATTSDPSLATYNAVNSILAIENPPVPVAPDYTPRTEVPAPSYIATSAPPLDYPQEASWSIPDSAGLVEVSAPSIDIGETPNWLNVRVLPYNEHDVAAFAQTTPEFVSPEQYDLSVGGEVNTKEIVQELATTLDFSGKSPLDESIKGVLFRLETQLLDEDEVLAQNRIIADGAAKGFPLPSGGMNDRLATDMKDRAVKRVDAEDAVTRKRYQKAVEIFSKSLATGIELERKSVQLFYEHQARVLEVEKYNVQMHIAIFDAVASMFNQRVQALQTQIGAYTAYVAAVIKQHEGKSAELEGIAAQVSSYQAEVGAYGAQVGTAEEIAKMNAGIIEHAVLQVREYLAFMDAVKKSVSSAKMNVEAYRTAIGAYARNMESDISKMNAYVEHVTANAALLGVAKENVQTYASYWAAEAARGQTYASWADNYSKVLSAETQEYKEYAQSVRNYLATIGQRINAEIGALRAYNSATDSVLRAHDQYANMTEALASEKNAIAVMEADANVVAQALANQAEAENARIEAGRQAAVATIQAGLAQAAYSAISVQASIAGKASSGYSGEQSNSYRRTAGLQNTRSYTRRAGAGS